MITGAVQKEIILVGINVRGNHVIVDHGRGKFGVAVWDIPCANPGIVTFHARCAQHPDDQAGHVFAVTISLLHQ